MSLMSFAALAVYSATIVAALSAYRRAWIYERPARIGRGWLAVAFGFACLMAVRLAGLEELARQSMRQWVMGHQLYELRRSFQAPLAALVVAIAFAAALAAWYFWLRKSAPRERWMQRIAFLSLASFAPLYALRLVSLHATDKLLYSGPIRLNWILELGLCLAAGASAIAFGEIVKRRARRSSRPSRRH